MEEYCSDSLDLENHFITEEVVCYVKQLLEKEPERSQIIFWMRVEGFSYYEIRKSLDISENSARVIEYRLRQKLKKQLEKEGFVNEL